VELICKYTSEVSPISCFSRC